MYELFIETLEKAGIVLPTWFFVIISIFIALFIIHMMLKKYIKPVVEYIEKINEGLEKTKEIDGLKEMQENEIKRSITEDEELKQEIKIISEAVMKTQKDISTFAENRVKDRAQSFQIQKELIDAQNSISSSIDVLTNKIDQMKNETDERFKRSEEKQDDRVRAELKDKIGSLYRYYHSKGEINEMEFEALQDLIKAYFKVKGNGFVRSVVEPEMYTWKLVEDDNNK